LMFAAINEHVVAHTGTMQLGDNNITTRISGHG
jgi:hypothetical protein